MAVGDKSMGEGVSASTAEDVTRATIRGIGPLACRTLLLRSVSLLTVVLLARWLEPRDYGLFFVCNFVVQSLNVIRDAGIGSVLVQQRQAPDEPDRRAAFTIQLIVTLALAIPLWLGAPYFARVYDLGETGSGLLVVLSLSMFLSSLSTIPAASLDRELQYTPRAWADVIQQIVYASLAITFAKLGYGAWSLGIGMVLGSAASTFSLYYWRPWRVRLALPRRRVTRLLRFGLPVHGQALLGLVELSFMPLVLGVACGPHALGFLSWAYGLSLVPHQIMSGIYNRMLLPSLSRLQHIPDAFANRLDRAGYYIAFVSIPTAIALIVTAPMFVPLVFGSKWTPAIPALGWFLISSAICTIATPYHTSLVALGRPGSALRIKLLGLFLQWVLGLPMARLFGYTGYAASAAAINLIVFSYTLRVTARSVPIRSRDAMMAPICCSISVLASSAIWVLLVPVSWMSLFGVLTASLSSYVATIKIARTLGLLQRDPIELALRIMRSSASNRAGA